MTIIILCTVSAGFSDENTIDFSPYLGLAIPVPNEYYIFVSRENIRAISEKESHIVSIYVNKKGRIENIEYPSELEDTQQLWDEHLSEVEFHFLDGKKADFPVAVPAELSITTSVAKNHIRLRFPLSPSLRSVPHLMDRYFELNNLSPPRVADLWPVAYKVDTKRYENDYFIITALVKIDSSGELIDLSYPIKGQDQSTHQIHVALINAQYEPARIHNQPIASEFILVFRIYDKIAYPFSPTQPWDSVSSFLGAEDLFMSRFLSLNDISTVPVPRDHRDGKVPSKKYGERLNGRRKYDVCIDTAGNIDIVHWLSSSHSRESKEAIAGREILTEVSWYPAVDKKGNYTRFTGQVTLIFNGTHEVVYIPEWLNR